LPKSSKTRNVWENVIKQPRETWWLTAMGRTWMEPYKKKKDVSKKLIKFQ
jgi:hypothetical protein